MRSIEEIRAISEASCWVGSADETPPKPKETLTPHEMMVAALLTCIDQYYRIDAEGSQVHNYIVSVHPENKSLGVYGSVTTWLGDEEYRDVCYKGDRYVSDLLTVARNKQS